MSEKKNTVIITAYEDSPPHDISEPEKNLLKAVLNTAISDLNQEGYDSKDARRFFLNQEEDYLFSFRSICSYLNIPPKQVLILTGLYDDPEFMVSYNRLKNSSLAESSLAE